MHMVDVLMLRGIVMTHLAFCVFRLIPPIRQPDTIRTHA